MFNKAKWIWNDNCNGKDCYCEFIDEFNIEKINEKVLISLSVDSDYVLYINGKYVASNQYADYPHYKVYDEIDISKFVHLGKNTAAILVWYFGAEKTLTYYVSTPGLIYEIYDKNETLSFSSKNTKSRKSKAFSSNREKFITTQLGFGFKYDSTLEDDWIVGRLDGFTSSTLVCKTEQLFVRPIKKTELGIEKKIEILLNEGNKHFIVDLNEEVVGLPKILFNSDCEQDVIVAWGEHLADGKVRRIIAYRDFSFDYRAKKGQNNFINYMLRIGCRYLELFFEKEVDLQYAGVIPATYNVVFKNQSLDNLLDDEIYNLCKHTLKSCMLEHYTDCPWREQALYAFDSRNQMLCGYYLFDDKNMDYVRANLILISKDNREDGLLSLCSPSTFGLVIPSYSLYYIIAVVEYIEHTGDKSILNVVKNKILDIIGAFVLNRKNGLISRFQGEQYWNFYEWSEGYDHIEVNDKPDCAINCLFAYALKKFMQISGVESQELVDVYNEIKKQCFIEFYDEKQGGFVLEEKGAACTEFINSLAVISGVCPEHLVSSLVQKLSSKKFIECSLAMKIFKYQVLIETDKEKYRDVILQEIRNDYGKMLKCGSTTAWETINGQEDFANAGSLCHGWSAYPVYIYNQLGLVKQEEKSLITA